MQDKILSDILSLRNRDNLKLKSIILDISSLVADWKKHDVLPSDQIKRHFSDFLVKSLHFIPDQFLQEEQDELIDLVSSLITFLCGKTSGGAETTEFEFKSGTLIILESTYTESEIGFQTWGSGVLFAKMIDQGQILVKDKVILELGCGTGLTGLVCALNGAQKVYMTDYHTNVLSNADLNVKKNNLESVVHVLKLDWNWALPNDSMQDDKPDPDLEVDRDRVEADKHLKPHSFEMIYAADCIFDMAHSTIVPLVIDKYLKISESSICYLLVPQRIRWNKEISIFEENMNSNFHLSQCQVIEKDTINIKYYEYKRRI